VGDGLYWNFVAAGNQTNLSGIVDAITGNITTDIRIEQESFSGSFAVDAGASDSRRLVLQNYHTGLTIDFAKSGGEPPLLVVGAARDVVVTDPNGQRFSFTVSGPNNPHLFPGMAGEWTITATSNDVLLASTLSFSGFTLD
jgi:hypothetical protein